MKLNQFSVIVRINGAQVKSTNQGMQILEAVASTLDGKQTIAFTAFKDKAQSLGHAMKPDQTWLITGSIGGRSYTDKNQTMRVANSCIINDAMLLANAVQPTQQPMFNDEDIPF